MVNLRFQLQAMTHCGSHRTLKVWDLTSGSLHRARKGHTKRLRASVSTEDGSMTVSAADNRELKVWKTTTHREIHSFAGYWSLAVSSDGRHIVPVSPRRCASLQVINCETWTVHQVLKGHTDVLRAIVIMPDNRQVVSASDDGTIRSWDMRFLSLTIAPSSFGGFST